MTWRSARYVAVGLIAFVIGLVAYLPASLVAQWATDNTPVRLDGVSGTLLDGQAANASLPEGELDNVRWHFNPGALLLGTLSASVQTDTDLGHISGDVARGLFGDNALNNVQGQATIGWVAKRAGYTFVPISGRVGLDLKRVSFDDDLKIGALAGNVQLTNSRWELLNPPLDLGRFKARLEHIDNGLQATIVDGGGPLALTGDVQLINQRRYDLNIRLRVRAGADARLKQTLRQIGKPDSEGWYRVRERGSL